MQALLAIPEVSKQVRKGELTIYCLYYRAESGVFAVYDPQFDSFRALAQ